MAQSGSKEKVADLVARAHQELVELMQLKREEARQARFKKSLGQLPKTHVIKLIRRDIARINTAMAQQAKRAEGARP